MPENLDHYCYSLTVDNLPPATQAAMAQRKGGFLKNARWQASDVITIRFIGGSTALQQ